MKFESCPMTFFHSFTLRWCQNETALESTKVCHRCNFSGFWLFSKRANLGRHSTRTKKSSCASAFNFFYHFFLVGAFPQRGGVRCLRACGLFVGGGGKRRASNPQPFSKMANLGPRGFPGGSQTKRFAGMFPRSGANSSLLREASEAPLS